jgi:hypothetical protein
MTGCGPSAVSTELPTPLRSRRWKASRLGAPTGPGILSSRKDLAPPRQVDGTSDGARPGGYADESSGEELIATAGVAVTAVVLLFAVFAGVSWAATMLGSWAGSF